MLYIVRFYALEPNGEETVVSEHEVSRAQADAYTTAPDTTLAAIRLAEPARRIDGFRVVDADGRLVLTHLGDDRG